MDLQINEDDIRRYGLPRKDFDSVAQIVEEFKKNLKITFDEENETYQDERQQENGMDEGDEDNEELSEVSQEEEQQRYLNRRERRNKGNNYASILASLL